MVEKSDTEEVTSNNVRSISGFRSVFKATSIFGGVQISNILISLLRGKVLAILIGTAGMGLNGLIMSSLTLINKVSGLGLSESAVRDISMANASKDSTRIQKVYTVFNRWIWLSAIIGLVMTISLSPYLSRLSFGDGSFTIAYILLSVTFIFGALTSGIYTLLRGMQRIKDLAMANISGSVAGVFVSIPIFFFYGIDGVVPAIIATSFATYLVSIYFRHKVEIKSIELTFRETFNAGKPMVVFGIILTVTALLSSGVKFILSVYISKTGSLEDLGIYNAGQSIMEGYVGMVFSAIGADYYPRLSSVIDKPTEWKSVVNQQAEIVVLILGPILSLILFSAPFLIKILLSNEFLPAIGFIVWSSSAVFIKGILWVSGFILISKGDKRLFLYTQSVAIALLLILNIFFYNILGITGLGMSMTISYLLIAFMMSFILTRRYQFRFSKSLYKLSIIFLFLLGITIAFIMILDFPWAYAVGGLTFIISMIISLQGLESRMKLLRVLKEKWSNRN